MNIEASAPFARRSAPLARFYESSQARTRAPRAYRNSRAQNSWTLWRVLVVTLCVSGAASRAAVAQQPDDAPAIFARIRALSLVECRKLATERGSAISLAEAKLGAARADLKDQLNRFKLNTQGGLDPFSGKIRFYLSLDIERLLQLNKAEREKAQQAVEAERIGKTEAQNAAIKAVTTAWYGLRTADAGVGGAARLMETTKAIHVSADARFRAGVGELTGVLSSLRSVSEAEAGYDQARQDVALACLSLAQACGYPTAEEMEAALSTRTAQALASTRTAQASTRSGANFSANNGVNSGETSGGKTAAADGETSGEKP